MDTVIQLAVMSTAYNVTISKGATTGILYVEYDGHVAAITASELMRYATNHDPIVY